MFDKALKQVQEMSVEAEKCWLDDAHLCRPNQFVPFFLTTLM